jgi:hypothetical protein
MASLRFSGLRYSKRGRQNAYALADALPTLSRKYAHHAPALLARAVNDGDSFVGTDGSAQLERWLVEHVPGAAGRIHTVRQRFCKALASETRSSFYLGAAEELRTSLLRDDQILSYILTGDESCLPNDFGHFSRQHAILHCPASTIRAVAA